MLIKSKTTVFFTEFAQESTFLKVNYIKKLPHKRNCNLHTFDPTIQILYKMSSIILENKNAFTKNISIIINPKILENNC